MATATEPRSKKGKRLRQEQVLTPIDQIPMPPGGGDIEAVGAWAYFLRPDGATISDTLVLYPNGGVPDVDDARLRSRYGENALYYQQRQARKGFEYIGPTLNRQGIRRLVEILAENREDEILFCEDEIEDCKTVAKSADRPEIRDQARKRQRQYEKRLDYLRQPLDAEALETELNDIARAQMLAKVDPNVLRVMRDMVGEVNERMGEMIARFQQGKARGEGSPARMSKGGADPTIFDSTGKDRIDL